MFAELETCLHSACPPHWPASPPHSQTSLFSRTLSNNFHGAAVAQTRKPALGTPLPCPPQQTCHRLCCFYLLSLSLCQSLLESIPTTSGAISVPLQFFPTMAMTTLKCKHEPSARPPPRLQIKPTLLNTVPRPCLIQPPPICHQLNCVHRNIHVEAPTPSTFECDKMAKESYSSF